MKFPREFLHERLYAIKNRKCIETRSEESKRNFSKKRCAFLNVCHRDFIGPSSCCGALPFINNHPLFLPNSNILESVYIIILAPLIYVV